MPLLSFFSSLAEAFRIDSYGPRYSEWPRRQADRTHHLHDDSVLADALGLKRVELVSSAGGERAWREFQDRVSADRAEAAAKHRPRKEIDARQRVIVNAALRGPIRKEANT